MHWTGDKGSMTKHTQTVNVMAVSKDGKYIASGDAYRYVIVMDAATKEVVLSFGGHPASIKSLDFNAAGTHLVTVATDMSFGLVNISDGKDFK